MQLLQGIYPKTKPAPTLKLYKCLKFALEWSEKEAL